MEVVMERTALGNAEEFGRHEHYGGWALGLLVACSVEPDDGHGKRNDRSVSGKVSARTFAKRAGTSDPRVMRYYKAWERAADKRIVPHASTLTPDDVDYDLPEGHEWSDYFDASAAGGRPRDSKAEDAISIIDRRGATTVVETMTSKQRRELAEALVETDPDVTTKVVNKAYAEKIEEATSEVRRKARRSTAEVETGEVDETAQELVRIERLLHMAELMWVGRGGKNIRAITNRLRDIRVMIEEWEARCAGVTKAAEITDADRRWADELGIELEAGA